MKKSIIVGLLCGVLSACSDEQPAQSIETSKTYMSAASTLLVEGNNSPLNVHNLAPRLSWHANVKQQGAYQIQAASSPERLKDNHPDLWDSGKVDERRSINIPYQGKALQTNQAVFWRVRVWSTTDTEPKAWSEPQQWQMGLLASTDWKAKWIQVKEPTITELTPAIETWVNFAGTIQSEAGEIIQPAIKQLQDQPTASLFRHQFSIDNTTDTKTDNKADNKVTSKEIVSAKLHSTAGGYYEIYINGKRVDDRLLDPGQTDYDKRILYNSDDVASLINSGTNSIAVHLGSGWYDESIAFTKRQGNLSYGQPKFIAQLDITFADGSTQQVTTNKQWKSFPSPVVKEGIFTGDLYDANKAVSDWNASNNPKNHVKWQPVKVLAQWPTKVLEPQLLPAIRAQKLMKPVKLFNPAPNVWVFDFGQNFTGISTLNIDALNLKPSQAVYLRYAEWANDKGVISQLSGGNFATLLNAVDAYIASDNTRVNSNDDASDQKEKSWTTQFTWRGFRYVEITGLTEEPDLHALTAQLIRSDVERVGQFESTDPLLNRIHDTAMWSYESNLLSLPMDCPVREKAGWTGDAHAALITGNYNFNLDNFWQKYLGDFKTAKFIAPAVVPGKRTAGEKIDWAVAEVYVAWEHYRHHGDSQLLASQYESLIEYMDFGESQLTHFLTDNGYGDWCDPVASPGTPRVGGRGVSQQTTTTVTTSALFARAADIMSDIAEALNKPEDQQRFATLFENIRVNFHNTLYNENTGHYGSQTADALALRFNITPEHLKQNVADGLNNDVKNTWKGHSSVGAIGQTWLYRALSDYGHTDTAFNIFKAKGYPGYSYLFDVLNGTTLWERKGAFDPTTGKAPLRSLNHPFHSGYDGWFYEGLGGIRPLENSVGYQDFALSPVFPKDLAGISVSHKTGYGEIKSAWKRVENTIKWDISIPNNTTALISLPNKKTKLYHAGEYSFVIDD
ncbi:MAG: family 78 glycoside hydrolase catalytic domain [Thalassotalea sp.]